MNVKAILFTGLGLLFLSVPPAFGASVVGTWGDTARVTEIQSVEVQTKSHKQDFKKDFVTARVTVLANLPLMGGKPVDKLVARLVGRRGPNTKGESVSQLELRHFSSGAVPYLYFFSNMLSKTQKIVFDLQFAPSLSGYNPRLGKRTWLVEPSHPTNSKNNLRVDYEENTKNGWFTWVNK